MTFLANTILAEVCSLLNGCSDLYAIFGLMIDMIGKIKKVFFSRQSWEESLMRS